VRLASKPLCRPGEHLHEAILHRWLKPLPLTHWWAIPRLPTFPQIHRALQELPAIATAVVWPLSDVAMKGTVEAAVEGLIEPTLIATKPP